MFNKLLLYLKIVKIGAKKYPKIEYGQKLG